jgi:hypothetical protein
MARKPRKESGTGVYRVMMRGINRQNIFEEKSDCARFLEISAECGTKEPSPLCPFSLSASASTLRRPSMETMGASRLLRRAGLALAVSVSPDRDCAYGNLPSEAFFRSSLADAATQ